MTYQVFARKYRPRTFDQILGQDHVVQTLKNAIEQGRIAQAYLFVGPRGTGKTTTARILAMALNCDDGPRVAFDPEEEICREIAEGRSLDVLEIDGASNNGVEQVRELRESTKFAPSRGRFKIYYIDEVHMLTTAAFNALLKTLEEPPPHVKFIFATTEPNKILPTILSRCQRFDLRPIPDKIIAEHLLHIAREEQIELDPLAAHTIAKGAEGSMRDAQSMLDQLVAFCGNRITEREVLDIFGFTAHETIGELSSAMLEKRVVDALEVLHEQNRAGKDLTRLLGDLIGYLRMILVYQVDPKNAIKDVAEEIAQALQRQAQLIQTDRLLDLIDHFAEVDSRMKWAPNKKMHFEIGIIKAVQSLRESNLNDVIAALSGAFPDGGVAAEEGSAAGPRSDPAASSMGSKSSLGSRRRRASDPSSPLSEEGPESGNPAPRDGPEVSGGQEPAPVSRLADGPEAVLWTKLKEQYPLVFAQAVFGGLDGGKLIVRFHLTDFCREHALEHRKEIERFLSRTSGRSLVLEIVPDEGLDVVNTAAELPPTSAPAAHDTREMRTADSLAVPPASGRSDPPERIDEKTFYEDRLIKDALEIFKGKLENP